MRRRGYLTGLAGLCSLGLAGCLGAEERDEFQIERKKGGCRHAKLVAETIQLGGRASPAESNAAWRVEMEPGEAIALRIASENGEDTDLEWPGLEVLDPADEPLLKTEHAIDHRYETTAEADGYHTIRLTNPALVSTTSWSVRLTWYSAPTCI